MQRVDEIVKVRRGRQITIRLDVKAWRKRMKLYKQYKGEILAHLAKFPTEQAVQWLNTPQSELRNRTPKAMFHPRRIRVLHRWWKKNKLDNTSTV